MKQPKLTNAELRARLLDKWRRKAHYAWKHFWCKISIGGEFRCVKCKERVPCMRYRSMPWVEWNLSALKPSV